jgi:hypothetical protein
MTMAQNEAVEFSIPLPGSLDTRIYVRLSTQAKAILLSLTTASQDELSAAKPMGSFVYALPNRFDAQQPLATTLFTSEATLEFTTRMARLLARKTQLPVYVTNSISLANTAMGGTMEEEMAAFKGIVEVVLDKIRSPAPAPENANAVVPP